MLLCPPAKPSCSFRTRRLRNWSAFARATSTRSSVSAGLEACPCMSCRCSSVRSAWRCSVPIPTRRSRDGGNDGTIVGCMTTAWFGRQGSRPEGSTDRLGRAGQESPCHALGRQVRRGTSRSYPQAESSEIGALYRDDGSRIEKGPAVTGPSSRLLDLTEQPF
jgi:hypothetical protein